MQTPPIERRAWTRWYVDLPAAQEVDGRAHDCRAVEISRGGVVLLRGEPAAHRAPRLLYRVHVRPAADGPPFAAVARTVWTKGRAQALRFVQMRDADARALDELLADLEEQGAPASVPRCAATEEATA